MIKMLPVLFLASCGPKLFAQSQWSPSESPCVDGTFLNMESEGCEVFYWGLRNDDEVLKIRCTYGTERSFWTEYSFYTVAHHNASNYYKPFCQDRYIILYAIPPGEDFRK